MNLNHFTGIREKFLPLVFITAMRPESQVLLSAEMFHEIERNGRLRIFRHSAAKVFISETGMGLPEGAAPVARELRRIAPKLLINFGICGALQSGTENFRTFFIDKVCSETEQESFYPGQELPSGLAEIRAAFDTAALLTTRRPIDSRDIRRRIFSIHRCPLVDMELYPLSQIAAGLSLPIIALKAVSDQADEAVVSFVKQHKKVWQNALGEAIRRTVDLLGK